LFLLSFFDGLRRTGAPEDRSSPPRGAFSQQALRFPLRGAAQTAILDAGFLPEPHTREFDPADLDGIRQFSPEALVAPLETALDFAVQSLTGQAVIPSLQLAVVVLTRRGGMPLTPSHRDVLWRAFAVPAFEFLRSSSGVVIARECEVHDGLHIDPHAISHASPDGDEFVLAGADCDCGAETPRLKRLSSTTDFPT
jgi:hypothetical protein